MSYYVYHHYDAEGNLRYIGMGHGKRAYSVKSRNTYWHNVFNNTLPIVKVVCEGLTEQDALKLEALHVFASKLRGDKITNLIPGGGKPPVAQKGRGVGCHSHITSEETKVKMSISQKDRKLTKEHKQKLSKSRTKYTGKNHPMFGKTHSCESRDKMSKSLKGMPAWNKGKSRPEISMFMKNWWREKKQREMWEGFNLE